MHHDRMIDFSQLTRHQAERMAAAMKRDQQDVLEEARVDNQIRWSRRAFACVYGCAVVWAIWGIGRVAYWW